MAAEHSTPRTIWTQTLAVCVCVVCVCYMATKGPPPPMRRRWTRLLAFHPRATRETRARANAGFA